MALFAAICVFMVIYELDQFLRIAMSNIWLNGAIIGATIFGVGLCFVEAMRLIPEYRWLRKFFNDKKTGTTSGDVPPAVLRPMAVVLMKMRAQRRNLLSPQIMTDLADMARIRFDDSREAIKYISSLLIFMGLFGTFWGLINTVGGFSDMISGLDFGGADALESVRDGIAKPLSGISSAFSASLLGLGGSLIVGFLGMQVQSAQNQLLREAEDKMSDNSRLLAYLGVRAEIVEKTK